MRFLFSSGHPDALQIAGDGRRYAVIEMPPPVRPDPSPRPHLVQHLDECDCGRAHPAGFICASTYKDRA